VPNQEIGGARDRISFAAMNLGAALKAALDRQGFALATPVQAEAVPAALDGRDVLGHSPTGSGKTLAFVLPTLERVFETLGQERFSGRPVALILATSRELAGQTHDILRRDWGFPVHSALLRGGTDTSQDYPVLRNRLDVVVGTPGRVLDHVERGTLDLSGVEILVLDEVDKMLEESQGDAAREIIAATPGDAQHLVFTATLSAEALDLLTPVLRNPVVVDRSEANRGAKPSIDERVYRISGPERPDALLRLIEMNKIDRSIIFCAYKASIPEVLKTLGDAGLSAQPMSSDLNQDQRDKVMRGFGDGEFDFLVASDVLGRGFDPKLVHMINYQLPKIASDYEHRIGRVGRNGRHGIAHSLVTRREEVDLRRIERLRGAPISVHHLPSDAEVRRFRTDRAAQEVRDFSDAELPSQLLAMAKDLAESVPPEQLARAALAYALRARGISPRSLLVTGTQRERGAGVGQSRDRGPASTPRAQLLPPSQPVEAPTPASTPAVEAKVVDQPPEGRRFRLRVGKTHGFTDKDAFRLLTSGADLSPADVATQVRVEIGDMFTFVNAPAELGDSVAEVLSGARHGGHSLRVKDMTAGPTSPGVAE
jgi:ATP-dependent RNA helicase DeaD